jgi:hypothetical protein
MKVCSNGHNANAVSHLAKVHKVDSNGNSLLAKSTITVAGTAATASATAATASLTAATASTTTPGSTTASMPLLSSKQKAADLSNTIIANQEPPTTVVAGKTSLMNYFKQCGAKSVRDEWH